MVADQDQVHSILSRHGYTDSGIAQLLVDEAMDVAAKAERDRLARILASDQFRYAMHRWIQRRPGARHDSPSDHVTNVLGELVRQLEEGAGFVAPAPAGEGSAI